MKRVGVGVVSLVLLCIGWTFSPAIGADAPADASATSQPTAANLDGVHDGGHFFDQGAIDHVNQIAAGIKQKYGLDLVIETQPGIPDALQGRFATLGREEFYRRWLLSEARRQNVTGIFILIVKGPPHLETGVGQRTRVHAFTDVNRRQLTDRLLTGFRAKKFDDAIVDAAVFVEQSLADNLGVPTDVATTEPAGMPSTEPTTVPTTAAMPTTAPTFEEGNVGPSTIPSVERELR